jgi:flagellar basal-body rod protein FlgC
MADMNTNEVNTAMAIAAKGLRANAARIRVISENIANAQSTARAPGADPYRRQIPVFRTELMRETGAKGVAMASVRRDPSDFVLKYEPGHPAADANGYVKYPNVNTLVESVDLREATRSYEANLNVIEAARAMDQSALGLLRK